jgi:hypothetical protein
MNAEAKMEKLIKLSDPEVRALGGLIADEVWSNDIYLVSVVKDAGKWEGRTIVHISIRRHDKKPITDWPDKQAIKNQLVGLECVGVEFYPADSELNDQANIYHLWVVDDPKYRFPFGLKGRATLDDNEKGELVE